MARDRAGNPVPGRRHRRAWRGGRSRGTRGRWFWVGGRVQRWVAGHRQPPRQSAMNHLLRSHAPISDAGWDLLDREARERLTPALAVRKLVDFSGPHGWEHSATNLGRTTDLASPPVDG